MRFYVLNVIKYLPFFGLRSFLLKMCGVKIGKKTILYYGTEIRAPSNLKIGASSIVGDHCILDSRGGLTIGSNVNISTGVWIWTAEHSVSDPQFGSIVGPVVVEDHAWLSCRTTILPGVVIGKGAVVAAGAVVTKSVAPYTIVGGVPAKKIGVRDSTIEYTLR